MTVTEPIRVEGLKQFQKALKAVDKNAPKGLRVALNLAAAEIIDTALPGVPRRTGRASATLKARSTQTAVRVAGGGNRAPYYPWLDFGGKVGRGGVVRRPYLKDGRYLDACYTLGEKYPELCASVYAVCGLQP